MTKLFSTLFCFPRYTENVPSLDPKTEIHSKPWILCTIHNTPLILEEASSLTSRRFLTPGLERRLCKVLVVLWMIHVCTCISVYPESANSQLPSALLALYPQYLFLLLYPLPTNPPSVLSHLTFYSLANYFPQSPLYLFTWLLYPSVLPTNFLIPQSCLCTIPPSFYSCSPLPMTSSRFSPCLLILIRCPPPHFKLSYIFLSFPPVLHPLFLTFVVIPPSHCPSFCRGRWPRQLVCQPASICPHHWCRCCWTQNLNRSVWEPFSNST